MQTLIDMITGTLTAILGWIPDIIEMAIAQPIILFFIGFGLCGALIRWARKLIHFA